MLMETSCSSCTHYSRLPIARSATYKAANSLALVKQNGVIAQAHSDLGRLNFLHVTFGIASPAGCQCDMNLQEKKGPSPPWTDPGQQANPQECTGCRHSHTYSPAGVSVLGWRSCAGCPGTKLQTHHPAETRQQEGGLYQDGGHMLGLVQLMP